jgi:hypothetical protein
MFLIRWVIIVLLMAPIAALFGLDGVADALVKGKGRHTSVSPST